MVIKLSGVIKKIQRGKIIRHKYQATDNKTMGYVAQISYLLKILSLYKKNTVFNDYYISAWTMYLK